VTALDFHGVTVVVDGDARAGEEIGRDFSWFRAPAPPARPDIQLTVWDADPPWDRAPDGRAVMVRPTCTVYDAGGERWVDYHGRALARWSYAGERGELWTRDASLAHYLAYLIVCSRVGERHDLAGLHRAHALGLAHGDRGVLCFLPSGGGKTTLGLAALTHLPDVTLLSDDTPLVTVLGELRPFPARLGTVGKPPVPVDPRHLRDFPRPEHGDKVLIDIDAFAGRVAAAGARPAAVLLGERRLSGRGSLTRVAAAAALPELMRSVVLGIGLPQVLEYFLRGDARDVARKAAIAASRAAASAALLARARVYRFALGRAADENAALLEGLLRGL
jgi:hypothetical protein